jgi:hypothetical protein
MKAKTSVVALLLAFSSASLWAESPCIECQKAAQAALASCLHKAKTEADKKSCNDTGAAQMLACVNGVCKK